ncbi:MAG: 30S ribosomal protein S1 [Pyrinomonadaceae bacterium]
MANEENNQTEETVNNPNSEIIQTNTEPAETSGGAKTETEQNSSNDAKTADEQSSNEMDFGAILEQFEQEQTAFSSGELVQGKVVGVSERGVLVDFGYKSEGVIAAEEFTSPEGELTIKPGDELEVIIKSMDSGDNPPQLSFTEAARRRAWSEIEQAYKEEKPVTGRIIDKTKGGLRVDIDGVEAFLPGSQIDSHPIRNLDSYIGKEIEAKVIKFSRKRNNIVLSRKVLTDEVVNQQKSETLNQIEVGRIIEGKVKSLTEYGAFVDIGGLDGLLHITDMAWGRLQNPNQMFKPNDTVQVKVLKLDREKEKISLGFKQLIPDPWSTVGEIYPVGTRQTGKVSSVTEYGAFVELEPGVEGLVHVSEMSWSRRSKSPKNIIQPGEEVEVQILGIDDRDRRISLGMKQLQPNPWDTISERYHVGDKVRGKVRNLTDFGVFVEIEPGVDGLVHVSDIAHSKKIKHPKDVLKKGDDVEAIITKIDSRDHRLSLSIKELVPSGWESFIATHRPGDIVRGKILRFAGFGVFAELGEELEGLCHISELSDERVNRAEDVVQIGQEMDFKILRIEPDLQKIGLSHRAVGHEDEPQVDTKVYSTEAKGGMASLGELANLKFGRDAEEAREEPAKAKKEKSPATENTGTAEAGQTAESASQEEPAETVSTDETTSAESSESAENSPAEKTENDQTAAASAEKTSAPEPEAETGESPKTEEKSSENNLTQPAEQTSEKKEAEESAKG